MYGHYNNYFCSIICILRALALERIPREDRRSIEERISFASRKSIFDINERGSFWKNVLMSQIGCSPDMFLNHGRFRTSPGAHVWTDWLSMVFSVRSLCSEKHVSIAVAQNFPKKKVWNLKLEPLSFLLLYYGYAVLLCYTGQFGLSLWHIVVPFPSQCVLRGYAWWAYYPWETIPIPSMYGIFTYIWLMFMVNVGKYSLHGWCGITSSRTSPE